ncbi:MAG: HAD family hydrolase [Schwartzia sp.]|nr:HAD family hydrolase [Schwartzia sp. (in: firmicutes)]
MIKIIFCDMDGTLLDGEGKIPPMFDEVMGELKKRGVIFAPASGRQYSALLRQMGAYIDDFIFISENGTFIARHDEEIWSSVMSRDDVRRALELGLTVPRCYSVLCGKRIAYVTREWEPYMENMRQFFTVSEYVDDMFAVAANEDIIKVAFCDPERGDAERTIYPPLTALNDRVHVVLSSNYWVDVMNKGVNKGAAVGRVQKALGVSPDECASFGDYLNDIEMLRAVRYGFAMENAHDEAKRAARYSAPRNTEYGVMTKLRELMDKGLIGNAE